MRFDEDSLERWMPAIGAAVRAQPDARRTMWRVSRLGAHAMLAVESDGLAWSEGRDLLVRRTWAELDGLQCIGSNGLMVSPRGGAPVRLTFPDVRDLDEVAAMLGLTRDDAAAAPLAAPPVEQVAPAAHRAAPPAASAPTAVPARFAHVGPRAAGAGGSAGAVRGADAPPVPATHVAPPAPATGAEPVAAPGRRTSRISEPLPRSMTNARPVAPMSPMTMPPMPTAGPARPVAAASARRAQAEPTVGAAEAWSRVRDLMVAGLVSAAVGALILMVSQQAARETVSSSGNQMVALFGLLFAAVGALTVLVGGLRFFVLLGSPADASDRA